MTNESNLSDVEMLALIAASPGLTTEAQQVQLIAWADAIRVQQSILELILEGNLAVAGIGADGAPELCLTPAGVTAAKAARK